MTAHPAMKAANAPISGKTTALRATLFTYFRTKCARRFFAHAPSS
jgi:hypothetical protein